MSDLQAATERVRRMWLGEGVLNVYPECRKPPTGYAGAWTDSMQHSQANHSWRDDLDAIATQYLAEHPADDGEAGTEEGLREVGFDDRDYEPGWFKWGRVLILHDSGKFDTAWLRPQAIYDLMTRGDVRRLLAALRIEGRK